MAVAAYASLVSLTHVLHNIHSRVSFHLLHVDVKRIEMLQESVDFLLEFVELHSETKTPRIQGFWRQIVEFSFIVEDVIDFHVVNLTTFDENMGKLLSKIDFIKKELSVVKEKGDHIDRVRKQRAGLVPTGGLFAASLSSKNVVVGIEEHVVRVMDELTKGDPNLQILPIVGMGGIGKTTLAKTVFDHPYIAHYFDMHIWFSISQEYSVEQILMGLIDDKGIEATRGSRVELGEILYKKLFGRKYLIVMDDVWTPQAWDDFRKFFPNNAIGSRIVLTTRLSDVASSLGSHNPYSMTFLDEGKSWDLFCQNTFGQIGCPNVELEEIGKDIVKSCKGLPLEIVVIGRLLANSDMTCDYWSYFAKNISSFGNLGVDEHCLKVLSLSYTSLPIHLKPCFLYMRVFPEDEKIEIARLIRLWVDEGFIKSDRDRSLEEIAEEYLIDLIGRNLVFVSQWTIGRKIKNCGIHDLLRDLCLRESDKEHFIYSPKVQYVKPHRDVMSLCFLCGKSATKTSSKLFLIPPSTSRNIPLLCHSCEIKQSTMRLVRVLAGVEHAVTRELAQPTKLRHFDAPLVQDLKFMSPSMLSFLWTLQTIYILEIGRNGPLEIPSNIWEMLQLRHLEVYNSILSDPRITHTEGKEIISLSNLQTLSGINNFNCSNDVVTRIPNLKTLNISYDDTKGGIKGSKDSLYNVAKLDKLETLALSFARENISLPSLPISIKKLVISYCKIPWDEMTIIGSLPNLEELELNNVTKGLEWNPVEGEFLRLKGLCIRSFELVRWTADEVHFPNLEWLYLENLRSLEEIPLGLGDIATLHTIQMTGCSNYAVTSAKHMWEEQQSMGNEGLKISVLEIGGRRYQIGALE